MLILERYLWKTVATSVIGTWLALTLLTSFFAFLGELGSINNNTGYGTIQALIYTAYGMPASLYEFFPTSTLIGTLLGLGSLSTTHELTAMRAAGISIARIVWIILQLGLVLVVIAFFLGEWAAPKANHYAQVYKAAKLQEQMETTAQSVWIKNADTIVHIQQVISNEHLEGITIYHIDLKAGQLSYIDRAATGHYQQGHWVLSNTTQQHFLPTSIETNSITEQVIDHFITPDMLKVAAMRPQQLAATELADFIAHQQANDLNSAPYELAYWTHFTNPLATLVMIILAAPLVFGSQRSAGAGQRVFIGILIGLSFYLLSRIAGSSSLVYGVPPLLAATAPLLIFLLLGIALLVRVR